MVSTQACGLLGNSIDDGETNVGARYDFPTRPVLLNITSIRRPLYCPLARRDTADGLFEHSRSSDPTGSTLPKQWNRPLPLD